MAMNRFRILVALVAGIFILCLGFGTREGYKRYNIWNDPALSFKAGTSTGAVVHGYLERACGHDSAESGSASDTVPAMEAMHWAWSEAGHDPEECYTYWGGERARPIASISVEKVDGCTVRLFADAKCSEQYRGVWGPVLNPDGAECLDLVPRRRRMRMMRRQAIEQHYGEGPLSFTIDCQGAKMDLTNGDKQPNIDDEGADHVDIDSSNFEDLDPENVNSDYKADEQTDGN